jgi:hypothetical protein
MLAICDCLGLPRLLSERFTFGPCRSQRPIGGDDATRAMRCGKLGTRLDRTGRQSMLAALEMSVGCAIPVRQSLPTAPRKDNLNAAGLWTTYAPRSLPPKQLETALLYNSVTIKGGDPILELQQI